MSNFKNFIIPGIILIFLSLIIEKEITVMKYIFAIGISALTTTALFISRIKKQDIETRKKIEITFCIFLFQFIFILIVLFKGIPELPFFISPFNNLYFYGVIFSSIVVAFIKNKKVALSFVCLIWFIIFGYQLLFQ